MSGSLDLRPTLSISAELNHGFAGIPDGVSVSASATVKAAAGITATLSGSHSWEIGEIDGSPIDIQVGPVPVVVFPKIPIFLNVSGQVSIGVSASMTVGASMSWTSAKSGR